MPPIPPSSIPIPGKPVRGSKSGDPIMALFDLLGRRWAMGILWTLCKTGPCTFRELQANCGSISPTVLNTRLKELRQSLLITHAENGYLPTPMGQELYELLLPIGGWSGQWAQVLVGEKE